MYWIGNRFYERRSPNGKNTLSISAFFLWRDVLIYILLCLDSTRTVRSVEYRDPEDVWKYTGGGKRLPSASHYNHSTYRQLIIVIIICTLLF